MENWPIGLYCSDEVVKSGCRAVINMHVPRTRHPVSVNTGQATTGTSDEGETPVAHCWCGCRPTTLRLHTDLNPTDWFSSLHREYVVIFKPIL